MSRRSDLAPGTLRWYRCHQERPGRSLYQCLSPPTLKLVLTMVTVVNASGCTRNSTNKQAISLSLSRSLSCLCLSFPDTSLVHFGSSDAVCGRLCVYPAVFVE